MAHVVTCRVLLYTQHLYNGACRNMPCIAIHTTFVNGACHYMPGMDIHSTFVNGACHYMPGMDIVHSTFRTLMAQMINTSYMYYCELCLVHICIQIYSNLRLARLMDTVGLKMSKRNAKTRLPYSPGQAAKPALGGKTAARRSVNRVPVVQREVAQVKPVTPADTTAVDNPNSGSAGAGKVEQTLSTARPACGTPGVAPEHSEPSGGSVVNHDERA